MSSPDEATSRALGRASLNLRQARRSLTEEKLKLMNEQVELAKQKESVEKDKMELIEQKKSLPPPPTMSPMPPPSSTQSPNDDAQGTMLRALARQNAALKTSRKSLTEEKLRWQNEFIKAQTEKQQAEEKATGLERRLSVSAGASPMFGPVSGHLQYPVGSPNSGDNLSLPPLPHQAHHEEEKTSSVLRAVRRQSLNLRRERQSLTEEKTKYMNEALALAKEKQEAQERVAELEKKLQESLQHLNTPTGSPIDGGASPNPSGLSTADSERLAAVQRASLAQLQRIKSARASARNSFHAEKDQLMKDTLRLEGEKAKTQEELQAKLQQLEADRQSHLQQITSQQESLRLEHLALQQEKSAMAAVKEAHAKAEKEILALRKSLEEEREKRMGESIKTASEVEQLHKQLDVERQKRAEDTAQLQAELARERQSRGEDSKRLESFSQASKSHTETLALVTHLQTTNSTLLAEVKGFQEAKHQLAEAQKRIGEREHELKKAFAAQDALENELREKREQLDVEQSAAREALQAELAEERLRVQEEMDMQRKRHEVALMEEVLNSRAAMNTAAQSMHSQHSLLWTQERETLLKLFEQDCEEQRQKLALEHHFHVSKERADLKTALNHLERERVKFENEKRRFHGNPAFREGGGVPRQQSAWGRPGSAAVQAAAEEHRATVAHQSQTAASLAHLSAAISSGFAGIQAVHQYPQRNELTIPDSPSNAQQARSESPQTATPRDGKPPAGPNSRLGTAANSSSRAPAS